MRAFWLLVAVASALALALVGVGTAAADDDPLDPPSYFSAFSAVLVGNTISWSATANCGRSTAPPAGAPATTDAGSQCANAGTAINALVPDTYNIVLDASPASLGALTCDTNILLQLNPPAQGVQQLATAGGTGSVAGITGALAADTYYVFPSHRPSQNIPVVGGFNWATANGHVANAGGWCVTLTVDGGGPTPSSSMITAIHDDADATHTGAVIFNLGTSVHDKATVTFTTSPVNGTLPAGSFVTFDLRQNVTNNDCTTGTLLSTSSETPTMAGQSSPASGESASSGALHAGSYAYSVTFTSGNPGTGVGQVPSAGPVCEPFTVSQGAVTMITTLATPVALGSTVTDSATVTGSYAPFVPTGTVDFRRYGDNTLGQTGGSGLNCAGAATTQAGVGLIGGTATSSSFGPLHAGDYGYDAGNYSGDSDYLALATFTACEPLHVDKATPTVGTRIHFTGPPDVAISGNPTTGAILHDNAAVRGIGVAGFEPSGSVTFTWTTGYTVAGGCASGAAAGSAALSGTDPGFAHPSSDEGPLGDGTYAFRASWAGNADYNAADSACEPVTVVSSITTFEYSIDADNDGTIDNGPWTCTNVNNNGNCGSSIKATNTGAKNKVLTNTDFYLVHVAVTNNSGVTQDVKIQGGLAAQANYFLSVTGTHAKGAQITVVPTTLTDVTKGTAYLDLSKTGNVVTWIINNMLQNTTGELWIWVEKGYTSGGLQAVTSSWSQVDCGSGTVSDELYTLPNRSALGEAMPGCVKSKYTGDLQVNVS